MSPSTESLAVLSHTANIAREESEEAAFTDIFTRHRQLVYRVCLRYLGHHHDAEDVTQETFRRAALAMPDLDFRRPIEPWLVTIAANRCRTLLSGRRRDRLTRPLDEEPVNPRTQPDATHQLALGEQLDRAMRRLPAHQRRAFELVHRSELSYPEAAGLMGRSIGTVKTWVRRAKLTMRDILVASETDRFEGSHAQVGASEATSSRSQGRKSVAARWIASALLLAGLYTSGQNAPSSLFLSNLPAPVTTDANGTLPTVAPGNGSADGSAPVDWQLVSLERLSRAQFSVEHIHALPVTEWVDRSAPTLDHFRSGIAPLGKTLHRVVLLFQCDIVTNDTSPSVTVPIAPEPSGDASLMVPRPFPLDAKPAMQALASIT